MKKTPAEYVNPYIGTIGHLLTATRPVTALPHSYAQSFPTVAPEMMDYFIAEKIAGFPIGTVTVTFARREAEDQKSAVSRFDMSQVRSHPYCYTVYLEDSDIEVSGTTAMHSFVYKAAGAEKIFLRVGDAEVSFADGAVLIEKRQRARRSFIRIRLSCGYSAERNGDELVLNGIGETCVLYAALSYVSHEKAAEIFSRELEGRAFE